MNSIMSTTEHMRWCKRRAFAYVEKGQLTNAVSSMASDLSKHPSTKDLANSPVFAILLMDGMKKARDGDTRGVHEWIAGFA